MIYIEKGTEPAFWTEFRKKNPHIQYNDLDSVDDGANARIQLKEYNVSQQRGLCAYCCRSIDAENSHNEHIKPKGVGRYANLSMEYSNIVASCNTDNTCGSIKGDKFDEEQFVSPLDPDCESEFDFFPNGEIVSDSAAGQYTIQLLNLNSYRLIQLRRARLKA